MTKPEGTRGNEDSFWLDGETSVIREEPDVPPTYNLEERTAHFGEAVIDFAKTIRQGPTTDRIISQLIGAATSVGANYIEADDSVSKEARETKHFLRMTVRAVPELRPEARKRWMEAKELHLIFARIWRSGKQME